MPSFALLISLFSFTWPEPVPEDRHRGLASSGYVATRVGQLRDPNLREASGLAPSRRVDGMFWAHNDSGWGPVLYAVGPAGEARGRVRVSGVSHVDWEDLASFEIDGTPYLLISDVGDNHSRRKAIYFHVIEEPQLDPNGRTIEVRPVWQFGVNYPDGPADCESVAVDIARSEILLITKREEPPRMFSVPLRPRQRSRQIATLLGEVSTIPPPDSRDLVEDPLFGPWRSQPTSMDISPAGDSMVVLTYRDAYLFRRVDGASWADALSKAPEIVILPKLRQSEAVSFAARGTDIYVTTEKRPAPLIRMSVRTNPGDAE